jgi:hypothetical protein
VIRKSARVAAVVAAVIAAFPSSAAASHHGSCKQLCGSDKSFAIIAD